MRRNGETHTHFHTRSFSVPSPPSTVASKFVILYSAVLNKRLSSKLEGCRIAVELRKKEDDVDVESLNLINRRYQVLVIRL